MTCTNGATCKKPFNIAIVGGGLGGVVLAIGLLRHGIPVHIYEAAKGFGEIGAGVAFGPNSVLALSLVSSDALEAYKKHATYNERSDLVNTWLDFRYGMDARDGSEHKTGDLIYRKMNLGGQEKLTGTCTRSCVHRARFLDELVQLIPEGTTSFNKSLTSIEEPPDGQEGPIKLTFADGSSTVADAVIGCDGIKSKVREHLYHDLVQPSFVEEYCYRSMVPVEACKEVLGDASATNGNLYVGYGAYGITYPVERGKSVNMNITISKPGSKWTHNTWLEPCTQENMLADLEGFHPGLVELTMRYGKKEKWGIFHVSHSKRYSRGRICLIGDSAHASTPHLGAGAGQAMEDAFVMSNLLAATSDASGLEKAFRAFDAVRRPRSQRVVSASRAMGYENTSLGAGEDGLRAMVDDNYGFIWGQDLHEHLEEAKALL